MYKRIAIITAIFACAPALAQVGGTCPDAVGSVFPGSLDTPATMTVAVNNLGTNLTATLSPSSTTMNVSSTVGWVPYAEATVDVGPLTEIVYVTSIVSSTVLGIVHPCESTSAVSHSAGAPVVNYQTAYAGSGAAKSAIYSIEAFLQSGGLNGTVNVGAQYQVGYYVTNPTGSTIGGDVGLTYNPSGTLLTAGNATVTGNLIVSSQTGSTQCASFNSSGLLTGTGSTCGSGGGGSGTVTASPQYEIASFTSSGTTALVSGTSGFKIQSGVMTVPALTVSGLTGGPFCVATTSGVVANTSGPCGTTNSGTANDLAYYASTGTTLSQTSGLTYNGSYLSTPNLHITGISGSQCLSINSNVVGGSGTTCATASGASNEIAFFSGTSNLVGGSLFTVSGSGGSSTINTPNLNATGGITVGNTVTTQGGSTLLYRCVTAGALRAGVVTSVPADCGSYNPIGLITN